MVNVEVNGTAERRLAMVRLRDGKPCRQKRGKIPIYSCFRKKGSSNLNDVVNIKSLNTGASLF